MQQKIRFLIPLLFLFFQQVKAQFARTTLTQYNLNALTINPAYAGSQMTSNFDIYYFGNIDDFELPYRSTDLTLHGPLALDGSANLGFNLKFVSEGVLNELRFRPSFAIRMDTEYGKLGIGIVGGINFFDVDENLVQFFYPSFFTFDLGAGIYFHNKYFFLGLSSINIYERLLKDKSQIAGLSLLRENPYYAHIGGVFRMNESVEIKPTALGKFSNNYELTDIEVTLSNELAFDLGASVIVNQDYWVTPFFGMSFYDQVNGVFIGNGSGENVSFNRFGLALTYIIGNLRMSYTLHRTGISGQGIEFPASHFISVGYDFGDEEDEYFRYF